MADLKTYQDWIAAGRQVRAGEKAELYLVAPDRSASVAVFKEDQTEPRIRMHDGWTEIVTAEQRPSQAKTSGPKVIVNYTREAKHLTVWCGPNKDIIKLLKDPKNKFTYDPGTHRWYAKRDGIDRLCEVLNERGCNVEATVDGKPYDWVPPEV